MRIFHLYMLKETWRALPEVFYVTQEVIDEENEARIANIRRGIERPLLRKVTADDLTIESE